MLRSRQLRAWDLAAAILLALAVALPACRCPGTGPGTAGPTHPEARIGGDRPALVIAPPAGPLSSPRPLVLALHGYGDAGANFIEALGYRELAVREGFVLVAPDGTPDQRGQRYWNATAACCNFFGSTVDDVAYLAGLLAEVRRRYPIDPRRIYLVGLSNGGFMAYRLACERAPQIAALISIAGAAEPAARPCATGSPVSVLQIHGDADPVVRYGGGADILGSGGAAYPGAVASVERWAGLDRCAGPLERAPGVLDLDEGLPGAETVAVRAARCPPGVDVGLWTIQRGAHVPRFSREFVDASWAWLRAHPKVGR